MKSIFLIALALPLALPMTAAEPDWTVVEPYALSVLQRYIQIPSINPPADTRAAAEFIVTGTYKQTDEGFPSAMGQTYRLPGGSFFELRGGRIARVTTYYNLKDWLAQIGAP